MNQIVKHKETWIIFIFIKKEKEKSEQECMAEKLYKLGMNGS